MKAKINLLNFTETFIFHKGLNIFIAPNGCGKTLLGKVLSGAIKDDRVKHTFKNKFIYINCLTDTLIADDTIKNIIKEKFCLSEVLSSEDSFNSDGLIRLAYIIDKVINTKEDLYIDLPETCLHINLQEHFIDYLKEAIGDRTIIVATHAPSILNGDFDLYVDTKAELN